MTVVSKVMQRGPRWLAKRLLWEFYAPTRAWSLAGINALLDVRAGVTRLIKPKVTNPTAVYDLRICPNTFDFAYFLYDAETHFRGLGFDQFQVCIQGWENSDLGDYGKIIDWEKRRKRVNAILVPMAEMWEGCSRVTVFDEPNGLIAHCSLNGPIFPLRADGRHLRTFQYSDVYRKLARRMPYSGFRAPEAACDRVRDFLRRHGILGPFVTLTVRAYAYQALRNTDMAVYFRFAEHLRAEGFTPVFIPDADAPDAVTFGDFATFRDACADLTLRAAIYELAFANFFTSNGVHAMAAFNNQSACVLALLNDNYASNTGLKRWESEGLMFGDQPFGGTTKHFIWAKESFENFCTYFEIVRAYRPVQSPRLPATETRGAA